MGDVLRFLQPPSGSPRLQAGTPSSNVAGTFTRWRNFKTEDPPGQAHNPVCQKQTIDVIILPANSYLHGRRAFCGS